VTRWSDQFERALKFTLQYEGGWADHPKDPGGATMKGVTLKTYQTYLGRPVSKNELKNIPDEHVRDIYHTHYWLKTSADKLPPGLSLAVFDFGVNSGPSRATRALQKAAGITPVDGKIGTQTLDAINAYVVRYGTARAIRDYNSDRLKFLRGLGTWSTFGKGWQRRVDACTVAACDDPGVLPAADLS
jgi:lysozyme family protein